MFKYSERPNTKACEILPKVDNKIAQERLSKLIKVQNEITEQKSKNLLNKYFEVLVESKNGTQAYARTRTNKQVVIKEPVVLGKTYQCKIVDVVGWKPIGKIEVAPNYKNPTTINQQLIVKEEV
jgi:tRNA-2-methylthio-N6-dimethylallyladenosine synthase